MTTIAYRDGVLAADTQVTAGDLIAGTMRKVARIVRDDTVILVAGAGDQADVLKFIQWIKDNTPRDQFPGFYSPESKDNFCAIVVAQEQGADPEVNMFWGDLYPRPIGADFRAFGPGRDFAYGAMAFGATAKQAVLVAGELDPHSSGICCVTLTGETPDENPS